MKTVQANAAKHSSVEVDALHNDTANVSRGSVITENNR